MRGALQARLAAVPLLVALGCGASCPGPKPTGTASPAEPTTTITLFYLGGLSGWYEPCGCEPGQLGGLDRMLGVRAAAAKGAAASALVTAGTTLAFKGEKGKRAKNRADMLADLLALGGLAGAAPGPADLAAGASGDGPTKPLPWLAANVEGVAGARDHAVVDLAGVRVGLVGVAGAPDEGAPPLPPGVRIGEPVAAARTAVAAARAEGALAVVLLLDGERRDAYTLASKVPGIDFVIVGRSERAVPFAEASGGTWIVEAGHQGEHLGVLELHVPARWAAGAVFASGDDAAQAAADLEKVRAQIADIEARLAAAGTAGASGDLGPLLARKRDEEKALVARAAATAAPPAPFFRHRAEPVKADLPGDPAARARIEEYTLALAALDYDEEKPPPPPEKGKPSYIGAEKCKSCHEEEYAVWEKTPHARAMETLVEKHRDKVGECVSCHVTGFRKPSGATLHDLGALGAVQCEVCHGPGSLHEEAGGYAKIPTLTPTASFCTASCHHPPHDSRFDFHKRLADGVLGTGHGDDLLKAIHTGAASAAPAPAPAPPAPR